jgi:hypothetical protein
MGVHLGGGRDGHDTNLVWRIVPRTIRKTCGCSADYPKTLYTSQAIPKTLCTSQATCFTKLLADVEVSIQVGGPFGLKACACREGNDADVCLLRTGSSEGDDC